MPVGVTVGVDVMVGLSVGGRVLVGKDVIVGVGVLVANSFARPPPFMEVTTIMIPTTTNSTATLPRISGVS